jgi:cholesterol transport system auxiliary component
MGVKILAAAAPLLALSACFGGGTPDALLTLTPAQSPPAGQPRTAGQGAAVTVVAPTVPQALRTTRVPVYVSDTVVQYLKDAVWVENPGPLFGRLLSETIAARTGRVVLDPSQYSHDPGTRLTGQLLRFGLDPNAMEVVVTYEAAIARGTAGGVATNRFEARVPVAEATPAAVAPALNQAANQVAVAVAAWLGS